MIKYRLIVHLVQSVVFYRIINVYVSKHIIIILNLYASLVNIPVKIVIVIHLIVHSAIYKLIEYFY